MDKYCVMGNPVEHSKSPWIHARFAQLTGQDLQYGKRLVALGGFAQAVREFRAQGGKGCNVTVPFKFESPALATQLTPRAQLAQAGNTLRFDGDAVLGDNTDGVGLVNDIRLQRRHRPRRARPAARRRGRRRGGRAGPPDRGPAPAHRRGQPHPVPGR